MRTKGIFIVILILSLSTSIDAQSNALYGSWQANNGTIMAFGSNNVSVGSDSYNYKVSGTSLTMYNENGESLTYKYQVERGQLYLYLEGTGTFILTKVEGNRTPNRNTQNANISPDNNRLYGTFCSYSSSGYSGSSSYSTTQRVTFDGQGHYSYGSESSYSGGGDGYNNSSGGYSGGYKVVENKGVVLTDSDGSEYRVLIFFVQDSGEITELKYDGVVYAKNLCN